MTDVFISYAQRAKEPTTELAAALVGRGFDVWYDVNLLPGVAFGQVIDTQIDSAKAVVTIWSPPALVSIYVPAESERALNQGKLICVRTEDVDPSALPTPFNRLNTPLYTYIDDIVAALNVMNIHPIGTDPDVQRELDQLSVRATLMWQTVKDSCDVATLQAFHDEYSKLKLFRELARERIAALEAEAAHRPAPALPPTRLLTQEDIQLRLDPGMHTAVIKRISVTADGGTLATASDDKTIRLWSLPDGALKQTLRPPIGPGDEGKVYAVALSPDGVWVAAGGWTRSGGGDFVTLFDAATGAVRQRLGPLPNVVCDLEISPDGTRLAAGLGGANGVRVWDMSSLCAPPGERRDLGQTEQDPGLRRDERYSLLISDTDYQGSVYGLSFAPDGRLATTSHDGFLRLYAPDLRLACKVPAPGGARPYGIAFSPDGAQIAVGYQDSTRVDVFDAQTLAHLYEADTTDVAGGNLMSVAWRVDGALAAGGHPLSGICDISLWPDAGASARQALAGPGQTILDLAPCSRGLAFGSGDPTFGLFDPSGHRILHRGPAIADLRGKRGTDFRVSPDGARLWFGLGFGSEASVLFDLAARTITDCPEPPQDLVSPDTTRLRIENWEDETDPRFIHKGQVGNSKTTPLALKPHEISRSLAIAPRGAGFVLGTEWYLRRFTDTGEQLWEQPVPGVAWGVHLARAGRLILAAYHDGTLRWHRAEDGAELLALFIHLPQGPDGPRDWILYTPQGYYHASSPEAETLIGWHVNNGDDEAADFYPVGEFAKTFNRPDIVGKALDGV